MCYNVKLNDKEHSFLLSSFWKEFNNLLIKRKYYWMRWKYEKKIPILMKHLWNIFNIFLNLIISNSFHVKNIEMNCHPISFANIYWEFFYLLYEKRQGSIKMIPGEITVGKLCLSCGQEVFKMYFPLSLSFPPKALFNILFLLNISFITFFFLIFQQWI